MPRIAILPVDLRNKIAAGEVIERPASVVKELIENAIDAGCSDIRVDVLGGGRRLIRVCDDGSGMDRDDALLAFERHATSKVRELEDLFRISSLGFRGEALPSIASVSRVRLVTALKGSASGVEVAMEGGSAVEVKDAPSAGTCFEVKDLFFNTPARKKFLKTEATETSHIIDVVTRAAIAHHGVGFTLTIDRDEALALPRASNLRERIVQIFGVDFLDGLIEASAGDRDLSFSALISKGGNFRNSRMHQYLFVNGRPVRDASLSHAVYKAFDGILPADKHPVFFLFLEADPRRVDFNVHPAKREIRFSDKEMVYSFILRALREAVLSDREAFVQPFTEPPAPGGWTSPSGVSSGWPARPSAETQGVSENLEFTYQASLPFIHVGGPFIAIAGRGGLTIIDSHAAHERILFERLLRSGRAMSQPLLLPLHARLTGKEHKLLLAHREVVAGLGIEIDDFGRDSLVVRAVPEGLEKADLAGVLSDIAAGLIDGGAASAPMREEVAARIACHSSVRGTTALSEGELSHLLRDLEETEHPDQCPHGRPTRIFYTLGDLNRLFKRQ